VERDKKFLFNATNPKKSRSGSQKTAETEKIFAERVGRDRGERGASNTKRLGGGCLTRRKRERMRVITPRDEWFENT